MLMLLKDGFTRFLFGRDVWFWYTSTLASHALHIYFNTDKSDYSSLKKNTWLGCFWCWTRPAVLSWLPKFNYIFPIFSLCCYSWLQFASFLGWESRGGISLEGGDFIVKRVGDTVVYYLRQTAALKRQGRLCRHRHPKWLPRRGHLELLALTSSFSISLWGVSWIE